MGYPVVKAANWGGAGVWAVVLYYRNWPGILATLDSLRANAEGLAGVLVVDNASGDRLVDLLREHQDLRVLTLAQNDGYAAGMNAGARLAFEEGATHVLLLTHEVLIPQGTVGALLAAIHADPLAGMAGPLLRLEGSGKVFSAGGAIDRHSMTCSHLRYGEDFRAVVDGGVQEVDWLDGACLLLRAEAFRCVQGFHTSYFLYVEEVDLALRLRASGWKTINVRGAVVSQATRGIPPYFHARNGLLLAREHGNRAVLRRRLSSIARDAVRDVRRGRGANAMARIRGTVDFFAGRLGKPRGW